jgi:signal transduction histidine kinase
LPAFAAAPAIAVLTRGRFYLARKPRRHWARARVLNCCICEHDFEPEDMAYCPAYSGPICSLCCSLDARCHDSCKPNPQVGERWRERMRAWLPAPLAPVLNSELWRYLGVLALSVGLIGLVLAAIFLQTAYDLPRDRAQIAAAFWKTFVILVPVAGVAAWLLVLAKRSWRVAAEESRRQTGLLMREIRAHERTDAALQKAKEVAEAANLAKSRFIAGLNHELRSPLNAVLGYAQLMERDSATPARWRDGAMAYA